MSFTKFSFWRSCFQKGRSTYDICDKSGNAQFGKTQFFLDTLYILILPWRETHYSSYLRPTQCSGTTSQRSDHSVCLLRYVWFSFWFIILKFIIQKVVNVGKRRLCQNIFNFVAQIFLQTESSSGYITDFMSTWWGMWMVFKVSLPSFHARYLPHWIGCKCSSGLEFDIPRAICLSSRLFIVIKVLPTFCAIWQKLIELPSPQGKDWQTWINYVTFYHCNRFFVETKGQKLKRKILEI